MIIQVPEYTWDGGLVMQWEEGSVIKASYEERVLHLEANSAGLVSLARLLLTLTQIEVPKGHHYHLDDSNAFEDGSIEIIVERI